MSSIINKQVKLSTGGSISFADYPSGSISASGSGLLVTGTLTTGSSNFATEEYVNENIQGLTVYKAVRVATTTGGNLTYTWSAGTFSDVDPTPTIDGITLADEDRILIKNQTNAAQNGVYIFDDTANTLTRTSDFDDPTDIVKGSFFFVTEGTVNGNTGWVCSTTGPITFNTTQLEFTQFSSAGSIQAGTGLTKTGNTLSVNASQTQITAIGTLTAGTWNATTITVPYGGTGTTSFTSNQLLVGNGSSALSTSTNMTYSSNTLTLPKLISNDTTASTSSSTGAITLLGGLGINNSTNATSESNGGALTVAGGVGIGSALYVGGQINATASTNSTSTSTGSLVVSGGVGVGSALYVGGQINATSPSASTSSSSGALVVSGGVGIGTTNDASSSTNGGALTVAGGAAIDKKLFVGGDIEIGGYANFLDAGTFAGVLNIDDDSQSTNVFTGAFSVNGGAGIGKNLYVGENLIVDPTDSTLFVNATDNNVGIGTTNPGSNKLQVQGAVNIASGGLTITSGGLTITAGDVSGRIATSTPSTTVLSTPVVNCVDTDITIPSQKLLKVNDEFELSAIIKVNVVNDPNLTTSFRITLPSKTTNFSSGDLGNFELVGFIAGYFTANNGTTVLSNIENTFIKSVPNSTNAEISFTSTDTVTDDIYIQVLVRYSA